MQESCFACEVRACLENQYKSRLSAARIHFMGKYKITVWLTMEATALLLCLFEQ
jgi:hypothetical protein